MKRAVLIGSDLKERVHARRWLESCVDSLHTGHIHTYSVCRGRFRIGRSLTGYNIKNRVGQD